jgi:hypothetical protein
LVINLANLQQPALIVAMPLIRKRKNANRGIRWK